MLDLLTDRLSYHVWDGQEELHGNLRLGTDEETTKRSQSRNQKRRLTGTSVTDSGPPQIFSLIPDSTLLPK